MDSDEDLKDAISTISDKCKICEIDHRPRFKPVVSVSLLEEFNKVVATDLKTFQSHTILHLTDHVKSFYAAAIVKSKNRNEKIEHLFCTWISVS